MTRVGGKRRLFPFLGLLPRRDSLVLKLWLSFSLLVVAVVLPLGSFLTYLAGEYYAQQAEDHLRIRAEQYAWLLSSSPDGMQPQMNLAMAQMMAQFSGDRLAGVDSEGRLRFVFSRELEPWARGIPRVLSRGLERARSGELTFGHVTLPSEQDAVFAAVPFQDEDGKAGALFLLAPAGPVAATVGRMRTALFWTAGGAILLSAALALLVSRRIARPLLSMEEASRALARGEFNRKIEVRGSDEIARLGAAINSLAADLHRLETTRREFLANVSHELRSPLAHIRGYSQALEEGMAPNPEEQTRYARIIRAESERLARLVTDLLDLAQLQEGRMPLRPVPTDVGECAASAMEKVSRRAQQGKIRLELSRPERLPELPADPDRIEQIFLNLLDNALAYAPEGGLIEVRVRLENGRVIAKVVDDGPGIPPEQLPLIWERFVGVRRNANREGGYGLGLSIVREIVAAHGGETFAESVPGRTLVGFQLPVPADPNGSRYG
ncbi:MAG: HAMP domain-containing protein [Firmicutes bacterium]|nr:HAMP domain-containing protein [Bacillota bacterium]